VSSVVLLELVVDSNTLLSLHTSAIGHRIMLVIQVGDVHWAVRVLFGATNL
jgi:hypothetical protein